MKLVVFNWRDMGHPKAGGAEALTDIVAGGLARKGHRVTLFTSHYNGAATKPADEYEIVRQGSEVTCRLFGANWLGRRRNAFDVVVDEVNTLPFLSPWIAPEKTVVYFQQIAREVWLKEGPPVIGAFGYLTEPAVLSIYRSTPIVALSESTAASCREVGLRGAIDVIPPGFDAPPKFLRSVPVPGLIGYVGRLNPSKRVDHIIRALVHVREVVPMARLEIIGSGPARELAQLRDLVRMLSLEDNVIFRGRVSDIERDAAFARFDVLVLASYREGWGLVVSEAAQFGVPAAVYPVPGLVDSTVDRETGRVAHACEPEALASVVAEIVGNRSYRDRLGYGARAHVRQYTTDRLIDRFEQVLLRRAAATS